MEDKKYTTTIRISYHIRDKLREQADKLGMDMSSYIAFLVMYKEQKDKEQETARDLLRTILELARNELPPQLQLIERSEKRQ